MKLSLTGYRVELFFIKGMLWETRLNIKSKNASGSKMALNFSLDAASWKTGKVKIGDIVLIAASPCWI